jgi:hypothetical protein
MTNLDTPRILQALAFARRVADYAINAGFAHGPCEVRPTSGHLGAALADSILQAGVNYRTVVEPRVERIVRVYPETATLPGLKELVLSGIVPDYLRWNHQTKILRFLSLFEVIESHQVQSVVELKHWLLDENRRADLLAINGIGPKTVDYLGCLVGLDCVAVDRHVKFFAQKAGVDVEGYESLKMIFTYAADLLGASRRGFDLWVWSFMSASATPSCQYRLL